MGGRPHENSPGWRGRGGGGKPSLLALRLDSKQAAGVAGNRAVEHVFHQCHRIFGDRLLYLYRPQAVQSAQRKMNVDPIKAIVEAQRSENLRVETELAQRKLLMRQEAQRLARLFAQKDPSLISVRLFGSLAREQLITPHSDIDIAVETANFSVLLSLSDQSDWDVDIVDLPTLKEPLFAAIQREGIVLYEKKPG